MGYDLTFAFADGRSVKTGAAGSAVEQFVGLGSELDCALEPVLALAAPGPGSVVPEPGPAVPLLHFCPSCWMYRSLL